EGLVMQQLLYAGEVRSIRDIEIPPTEVKDVELKLAKQLIDAQTSETFDPAQYRDEVAARIEAAVQQKVEGREITLSEAPETSAQVIDLMEALRASLERKPAGKGKPTPVKEAAAAKAATPAAAPARKPPKRVEPAEPATTARKRAAKG
ncbi:MAG TPA: hypothetical protein VFJ62_14255, partial [Usitatibacter sp.]|nr:hypothetical protein [Usitatibacter sp.]